ncbi:MAG: FAD binding domain-containing protein [Chloroflexi bacterium]|nr:FAD binding domain-containing protein [Chloroflexota bacterium]
MPQFFDDYFLPATFDDALELLARYAGNARVIAGGTDLLLDFQNEHIAGAPPHYAALIDVTRIAGANEIRGDDNWIVIGCGVTHSQIVASALIQTRATALAEACAVIGGPQVRNVATLIGNVAHALPAADGTLALMVLDAEAQVKSEKRKAESEEWRPLAALFSGPGECAIDATREIICALRFHPTGAREASAFARVMRPQGIALPIMGMACKLKVKRQKSKAEIQDVAICAGPVAPVPMRARETEEFLRGKIFSEETLTRATEILLREAAPRTSAHRATKEYRVELLPMLLRETLTRAIERARLGDITVDLRNNGYPRNTRKITNQKK